MLMVFYLNSQLDVDGTAILRNTLNVQNNVDFDQNLNVDGDNIFRWIDC